jgi:hypothetical protein
MMAIADVGEAMPVEMGINGECKGVRGDDGHRAQTAVKPSGDGHRRCARHRPAMRGRFYAA